MSTPFRMALSERMRAKARELRREGTVGVSLGNFRQLVTPPPACAGAPVGANAGWHYERLFAEVALGDREVRRVLLN